MKKLLLLISILVFGCFTFPPISEGDIYANQYKIENNEFSVLGRVSASAEVNRFLSLIQIGPGDIYNRAMMALNEKAGMYGENVGLINISIDKHHDSFAFIWGTDKVSISADVIKYK